MGSTHEENDAKNKVLGAGYRILRPIGRGGAGDVFEAEHIALNQRVVLKILRTKAQKRPDLVHRMRLEAMALSRIRHPNLVTVTDFGFTGEGKPFLVMERLYGHTLREELEHRRRVPISEALAMMQQILSGLSAVHQAGIVHRDIKLDNLFVCDENSIQLQSGHPAGRDGKTKNTKKIKILDLGVAKVLSAGEPAQEPRLPVVRTDTGQSLGTPRFFSPEQALSHPVDARSDLYAAGAVLYTLIAGRGPFDHYDALYDLVRAHALEIPEPPSSALPGAIPIELDKIIMKSLAKKPEDRYASAEEFAEALAEFLVRQSARPSRPRWASTEPLQSTEPAISKPMLQTTEPAFHPFHRIAAFVMPAAATGLAFFELGRWLLSNFLH